MSFDEGIKNMIITLVVPIYNMSSLLPRFMESVRTQSCENFEVILVDDGSTDASPELCDRYADKNPKRIRVIHKQNGGLSSARNVGIEAARGECITFPDPDDWLECDYVEKMNSFCKEYQTDLVCTGYYTDHENGKWYSSTYRGFYPALDANQARKMMLTTSDFGGFAWNKLYKVSIIKEHNLHYLDDTGITEDLDFTYRYLQFCQSVCFAPEAFIYHYYQRQGAATHSSFSQHQVDSLNTFKKIIIDTEDESIKKLARVRICNEAVNLIWKYKSSKSNDVESYRRIRQCLKENLKPFLISNKTGKGRKIQAVLALLFPTLYCFLKSRITKDEVN